jgi:ArsR family metal-binding transcriptional regulator
MKFNLFHDVQRVEKRRVRAMQMEKIRQQEQAAIQERERKQRIQEERKERAREHKKKWRARTHRAVYQYLLGHPCVDCGETDPVVLEFEHIVPGEKAFTICTAIHRGIALERIMEEIGICEVRCANCRKRRLARQQNYWKMSYVDSSSKGC